MTITGKNKKLLSDADINIDGKILKFDIFRNGQALCDFVNSNDVEIVTIIASASSTDRQLYYYESKVKKK